MSTPRIYFVDLLPTNKHPFFAHAAFSLGTADRQNRTTFSSTHIVDNSVTSTNSTRSAASISVLSFLFNRNTTIVSAPAPKIRVPKYKCLAKTHQKVSEYSLPQSVDEKAAKRHKSELNKDLQLVRCLEDNLTQKVGGEEI